MSTEGLWFIFHFLSTLLLDLLISYFSQLYCSWWDGSVGRNHFHQAWWPDFYSLDSSGGKREPFAVSCTLASTCTLLCTKASYWMGSPALRFQSSKAIIDSGKRYWFFCIGYTFWYLVKVFIRCKNFSDESLVVLLANKIVWYFLFLFIYLALIFPVYCWDFDHYIEWEWRECYLCVISDFRRYFESPPFHNYNRFVIYSLYYIEACSFSFSFTQDF